MKITSSVNEVPWVVLHLESTSAANGTMWIGSMRYDYSFSSYGRYCPLTHLFCFTLGKYEDLFPDTKGQ